MGFGLWRCSFFAWVSSWPTAPKACVSCLCKISWVLLLVLTNKSCISVKVFWDQMYLCQVWNHLPQGIPPRSSGSGSSFWPSSCTSGSSSSFPWRSQASIFAVTVAAAMLWAQEADTKQEGPLQVWAHPLKPRLLPCEPCSLAQQGKRWWPHKCRHFRVLCNAKRRWEKTFDLIKCVLSNLILKSSWNISMVYSTQAHTPPVCHWHLV